MESCNRSASQNTMSMEEKVKQAINLGSKRRLQVLLDYHASACPNESFDSICITSDNLKVNPLGFCLLKGSSDLFKLLVDNRCDINTMEKILEKSGVSPILHLCSKGFLPVLEQYFPFFLHNSYNVNEERTYSIALTCTSIFDFKSLPIHTAAHYGNISIINFFSCHFAELVNTPQEFDIHTLEDVTGENCALIACREGHFNLVKYLHENSTIDFKILNSCKENAIMIAIAGMNRNPNYAYVDIIEYLIENIGIDVTYMYEDILLLAQMPQLVKYLEKKLVEKGITDKKKDVEKKNPHPFKNIVVDCAENCGQIFTASFLRTLNESANKSIYSTISYRADSIDEKLIENLFKPPGA